MLYDELRRIKERMQNSIPLYTSCDIILAKYETWSVTMVNPRWWTKSTPVKASLTLMFILNITKKNCYKLGFRELISSDRSHFLFSFYFSAYDYFVLILNESRLNHLFIFLCYYLSSVFPLISYVNDFACCRNKREKKEAYASRIWIKTDVR